MSDFIAHVIAELDTSKAEAQLNALTSKKYKLQFDTVDTASMMKNLESDMAKAGKDAGSSFSKNLSQSLSSANVNKQFSSINNSIAQTNKNLNNVNVHGLDNVIGSVTKYFSAYRLIANGLQELKNGFQLVTAVDDAMTNISYTMDVSTSQLQKFSAQAIQMAQDLTNVIGLLEKLTSTFGSLGTIGAGMTLFSLFKNRSYFSTMASAIAESTGKFENFGAAVSMAGTDLKGFLKTPSGIATAVGAATAVIGIAVQAYQNYQRELRETRESQLEQAQAAISNADAFEDAYVLASQYAGKTSLTADEESKFKAAVEGASEALGGKSDAFDSASGSAQTYLEKLQEVEAEHVRQAKINATKERDAAEKLLKSDAYSGWSGSKVTIDLSGRTGVDEFVKAKEVLEGLMKDYIDLGTYGEELEPLNWDADTSNMDAVVDYYYQLINLQDQLADKNLTNNDIYDDSSKIIKNLKDDVDAYVKAKYDELKYSYEAKNGIPTTVEEYNKMHDSILDNIDASQEYKDVLSDMMQQDFSESIDFDAIGESAGNAAEQIEKAAANATSSLAQMSQKAQDVVSSIKSVQDVLNAQTTGKSMSLSDWNSEELKDYLTC